MTKYYLIPWSVGFECRTVKPEGYSIEVINFVEYETLLHQKNELLKKYEELQDFIIQMQDKYDLQHRHDRNFKEKLSIDIASKDPSDSSGEQS